MVSFIGFAPAENPQIAIYTVIDEPNVADQAVARYATLLTRDILTEVLPYMNIFRTEELTEAEAAELAEKELNFSAGSSLEETQENDEDEAGQPEITVSDETNEEEEKPKERKIEYDPETGYAIDPTTGDLLDPETGRPIDPHVSDLADVVTMRPVIIEEDGVR